VSQLKSKLRQAQAKQKRAIDNHNRKVREHNRKVKRAVDDYNRAVRSYNAQVRANRQRLKSELTRLQTRSTPTRLSSFRSSSQVLYRSFTRVETRIEAAGPDVWQERFLDLSEREAANSIAVVNALEGDLGSDTELEQTRLDDSTLGDELIAISPDLDRRWRGALFALDSRNPDAARHFCASSREIFTQFLEICAPDVEVLSAFPKCELTERGRPTRRSKIRLLLARRGAAVEEFEAFVEHDVENIMDLFRVFNDGTHGSAGRFSLGQLRSVKRRVEDGILFLANLMTP
jgi:hypothetical protein